MTQRQQFNKFHKKHPEVFELFRKFAWELKRKGVLRHGAFSIINRIRWETAVNPDREGGYKVPNMSAAYYARMLRRENKEFFGNFFEFRTMKEEV